MQSVAPANGIDASPNVVPTKTPGRLGSAAFIVIE